MKVWIQTTVGRRLGDKPFGQRVGVLGNMLWTCGRHAVWTMGFLHAYTLWSKKLNPFKFLNNSVKNEPISTVQCYASTICVMVLCLPICLSVCLSQAAVLSRWLNVSSCKQCCIIARDSTLRLKKKDTTQPPTIISTVVVRFQ